MGKNKTKKWVERGAVSIWDVLSSVRCTSHGSSLSMTMLTMGTLLEKHDFSEAPFGLVAVLWGENWLKRTLICKLIQAAEDIWEIYNFTSLSIICVVRRKKYISWLHVEYARWRGKRERERDKSSGAFLVTTSRLLLGLNPLTTGQAGGRCSAEALSSRFFHSGANWDLPGLESSKTAYNPGTTQRFGLLCC